MHAQVTANTVAAVAGATGNGSKGSANGDGWDTGGGCEGTREQCAVRGPSRGGPRGPGHTELPRADQDPTGGKLENPGHQREPITSLTTPDQRDLNGASHTGTISGAPDTGGNTTATPIAEQNKDELAYLAGGYEPNKGAVGNMGELFKQPGSGSLAKVGSKKTSNIYQGQSIYNASRNLSDEIRKGDQFYLDASHKNHLEVLITKVTLELF